MPSPDQVLSTTDPGDDMIRRVRYQAAYGALISLRLLAGDDDLLAIFCEQHEDILVQRVTGKFVGIQVKTRNPGEGPFKTSDEAIGLAIKRFVALDLQFPGHFDRFVIVANCDFYDVGNAETALPQVLRTLLKKPTFVFKGTMKALIAEIKDSLKCSQRAILSTLLKTRCEGKVPKFEDITGNIAVGMAQLPSYANVSFKVLLRLAEHLIADVLQASALTCNDVLRSHIILATDPEQAEIQKTLEDKKITRTRLLALLGAAVLPETVTLQSANEVEPSELPLGHHRLERKMAAGGISALNVLLAKDNQAVAEFALQQWLHKYGTDDAGKRRAQVELAVRNQCQEAYDETFQTSALFGQAMLQEVRQRLMTLSQDAGLMLGLRYEHLLGLASLSTEECRTWWSPIFPIGEGQ